MKANKIIEQIVLDGSVEEKLELYGFDRSTAKGIVAKKFKIFARDNYPRYFKCKSSEAHEQMILNMIESYYGLNYLNIAGRGLAKTTLKKLFDVFVLLNDKDSYRKYMKVLTKDGKNSKQIVTDVYNLMVEVRDIYGDVFEKEGDVKREETMGSFTMKNGRKYSSGTIGQTQRGHVQDAYRPDWIWFDDVEDRDSIRSQVITQSIIDRSAEAIDGLSKDGSYCVTGNYISEQGVIEWFKGKPSVKTQITAILNDKDEPTWPEYYTKEDIERIRLDADDFFGEFMCDPSRSTNKFFDLDRIQEDMKLVSEPKRVSVGVNYWAEYQPHHRYGQGSDHSDGVGLDSNALAGFDFTTGELIYTYANNEIAPDLSAHEFARVGSEFGNCLYAPEVNNKCGGVVLSTLKHIGYPNLYKQVKEERMQTIQTDKLGWETNKKTKHQMFFDFKKDYNDGLIKIHDVEVLKEMKAYSNADLQDETTGLITRHYDLLTAVVIAWQMCKYAKKAETQADKNAKYNKGIDKLLSRSTF